jgi:quinol monooxygenase YgiN
MAGERQRRATVKYTVTVRARLRQDQAAAKNYHDEVTRTTKDAAKKAGDLTHRVFLDPRDPKAFLGIDEWSSLEGIQAFAGSPQIKEFFGKLFDGEPEVHVWVDSDWNAW